MTKPLNLTKQEAECLRRIISHFKSGMTTNWEFACKPFIEHLEEKLAAMKFSQEKIISETQKQKLKTA